MRFSFLRVLSGSNGGFLRSQTMMLAGVLLSLGLHTVALAWWLTHSAPPPLELGIEQAVTVDLLTLTPPAGEQAQQPAAAPPPEPPAPEVLQKDDMAERHTVVKKQRKKKPQPVVKPLAEQRPNTPAAPASAVAPSSAPPAPVQTTAARYDAAYLNNPAPPYTSLSRRMGEQGTVLLKVQVSAEGRPLSVAVKKSSGFERLDEAAVKAAANWRFVPAKQGNAAVVSGVEVPIQFSLHK